MLFINLIYSYAFRSERTKFNSILSEDVLIMPCKGILRACAMSLPVSSYYLLYLHVVFDSLILMMVIVSDLGSLEKSSEPERDSRF